MPAHRLDILRDDLVLESGSLACLRPGSVFASPHAPTTNSVGDRRDKRRHPELGCYVAVDLVGIDESGFDVTFIECEQLVTGQAAIAASERLVPRRKGPEAWQGDDTAKDRELGFRETLLWTSLCRIVRSAFGA